MFKKLLITSFLFATATCFASSVMNVQTSTPQGVQEVERIAHTLGKDAKFTLVMTIHSKDEQELQKLNIELVNKSYVKTSLMSFSDE